MSVKRILLFSWLTMALITVWSGERPHHRASGAKSSSATATTARIGGDFTLSDHTGKIVHDSDFRGRIMLVFFGFTHCVDICPVTVATLSKTMDLLSANADQVAPIFISVDPAHDTPGVLKDYLANFNPHLIGLTGTPEQIKTVADAYKTYYAVSQPAHSNEMPDDGNDPYEISPYTSYNDYTVDHSGFIYMMGKDGAYIRHFPYNASEQELVDALQEYMGK